MKQSPVRLEHYHLTALSILPSDDYVLDGDGDLYPKFADAEYQIGVRLAESDDKANHRYLVHLDLNCKPKEGRPFPYTFAIGADAIISFHGTGQEEVATIQDLSLVNGASMLYSALREVLMSISSRFPNGPIMLPSANFIDLRKSTSEVGDQKSTSVEDQKPARKKRKASTKASL